MSAQYQADSAAPETTRVSIVIPCRNGGEWLAAQLDALAAQDYPGLIEVIVADNGSDDDSPLIAAGRPGVRIVDASGRPGPNFARNTGAAAASGDVILTCDADDLVEPGWVAAMVSALRDYDLAGGRLDYTTLNPQDGAYAEAKAEFDARFGFLPVAVGANFGIRAEVLRSLGGWDEDFDGGPDDTELCWRAQLAGYRFGRADDAVVRYRMRTTTASITRQAYQGGLRTPLLVRRFHGRGMPLGPIIRKGLRWIAYLALAAPVALFHRGIRREWLRRGALAAGVVRGMLSRRR